jgi:4-hydroxy-tetrahydrodipicolinate reductase
VKTRVCISGATGKVGRGLVRAIAAADDLALAGAVARTTGGRTLDEAIGVGGGLLIRATVEEALSRDGGADVLVDYTSAGAVLENVTAAVKKRVHVVVGSSGLTDADFAKLDALARAHDVGVFAAGNFALTAVLLQRFATIAARHVPTWEIIDYAYEKKPDAPSGTARELASKLEKVRSPEIARPIEDTVGDVRARGATIGGMQLHSVRMPGFSSSIEILFGMPGERLTIRHDSIDPTLPYVGGTLLAVRRVRELRGVVRGLDALLDR